MLTLLLLPLAALLGPRTLWPQGPPPIPADSVCAHPAAFAGPCETVHGRLALGNGTPLIRIWKIGTKRILGVPEVDEEPYRVCALPKGVEALLDHRKLMYADFVIRPLTPSRPGYMQMVCVVSASHV